MPLGRVASFALAAWIIASFASVPAMADDPTQALEETVETLPSPTPDLEDTVGTVNDTVTSLEKGAPGSGGDGGSGGTQGGGGSGGGSGDAGSGAGSNGGSDAGSAGARSTGGAPSGLTVAKKSGGASDLASGSGDGEADEPYATLAARGTVAAAGRALKLAGPLAPALGLAVVALFVVFGLSRGSSKLVKLDDTRFPEHTFRL